MKQVTKNKVYITQTVSGGDLPTELKVEAELYKDGDKWCCLIGENIQNGVCGFSSTIGGAIQNCAANASP